MENHISAQLALFGQSVLLGLAAGFLYDLLRAFRMRRRELTWLLDLLYCFLTLTAAFLFLLRCGEGELRLYALLGAAGGGIIYFGTLSEWFRSIWRFWVENLTVFLRILFLPGLWLIKLCTFFRKMCKNLFYFTEKCYTMRKITGGFNRPVFRKGGGKRGQAHKEKK